MDMFYVLHADDEAEIGKTDIDIRAKYGDCV